MDNTNRPDPTTRLALTQLAILAIAMILLGIYFLAGSNVYVLAGSCTCLILAAALELVHAGRGK